MYVASDAGVFMLIRKLDSLEWSYIRYAARLTPGQDVGSIDKEQSLQKQNPPLQITITRPSIVVDIHGYIVAALFPGILSSLRQVSTSEKNCWRGNSAHGIG